MQTLEDLNLGLEGRSFVLSRFPESLRERFMMQWLAPRILDVANQADAVAMEPVSAATKRDLKTFAAALRATVVLDMTHAQARAVLRSFFPMCQRSVKEQLSDPDSSEGRARALFNTEALTLPDANDDMLQAALWEGGDAADAVRGAAAAFHRSQEVPDRVSVRLSTLMLAHPDDDLADVGPGLAGRPAEAG